MNESRMNEKSHAPLPQEQHGQDLTDVLEAAKQRGYTHNLSYDDNALCCGETGERFEPGQCWISSITTVDMGTDPGDDSTVYLIDTESGLQGYVVVPASFYAEPGKAAFIDRLKQHPRSSAA